MELCFWIRYEAQGKYFWKRTEQDCNQVGMCLGCWLMVFGNFVVPVLRVVCFFVLTRLKDPGRERTESRTPTATRTSSKTAVRCSVGQHTRGNFFLLLSMSSASVPVIDYTIFLPLLPLVLVNNEQDAVSDWLPYLAFQHLGQKRTNAGGIVCFCNAWCT